MRVLRWIVRLVVALVALLAAVYFGARFHDGPLGPIPGGPLASGPRVGDPVADWTFAADVPEIELQLASQDRSRTVWVLVADGKAYVQASTGYPPGKGWHKLALEDGRATLRIRGERYPVTLSKVDDPALQDAVLAVLARKYPNHPSGEYWVFAVTSRSE